MTAEIAVLNSEAVALAADSAVTIQSGPQKKTYTTANKLFELSRRYPVGIMIYGSATFMGLPWETIIKVYRRTRSTAKGFDTVEGFARDFLSFLKYQNIPFNRFAENNYIVECIEVLLRSIREEISKQVQNAISKGQKLDKGLLSKITEGVILNSYEHYRHMLPLVIPAENARAILRKYQTNKFIKRDFGTLSLPSQILAKLRQTIYHAFTKSFLDNIYSGVVFAGFGNKEFTPQIKAYQVEGIIRTRLKGKSEEILKHSYETSVSTEPNTKTAIIPFAQKEMVHRFMDGVDPSYLEAENSFLSGLCSDYVGKVVKQLHKYSKAEKKVFEGKLNEYNKQLIKEFYDNMGEFVKRYFSNPIVAAVSGLSKTDLAAMAEALVYLTSLKRKVSDEPETVAEPIDVAIISKGDGFIWIKRKHYFEAELNPQYFIKRKELQ